MPQELLYLTQDDRIFETADLESDFELTVRLKAMTWAERLKRVFNIDITICSRCGAAVRIIACIEDPSVIKKILAHLDAKSGGPTSVNQIPEPRAPPQESLWACP